MKIHARLTPLEGKYYGSEIQLSTETGGNALISVWVNNVTDYSPSKRELENWNEEEYGEYEICDDHYETQGAYIISQKIVEALDGIEL